jgi:peptidoglycan/xylan/chitin deacetylase (PgdA/CDA1 family)
MASLAQSGIPVAPLENICERAGAVALTFDDGFQNFYEHAFPVLRKYGFPATVFVVTGFCGAKNHWPSQPAIPPVPLLPLMRWSELREIAQAGISLGSHTSTHPRLAQLSEPEVEEELRISQSSLEDQIGQPVTTFAYPYGETAPHVKTSVRRRYRIACGTKLAYLSMDSDGSELPRLDTYYLRKQIWFRGLGSQYGAAYIAIRRALRDLRSHSTGVRST